MRRAASPPSRGWSLLAAVIAASLLAGCDMCEEGTLRCQGHVVEECNSSRNWEKLEDCGADTCLVGRDNCPVFIDLGGEVWCCRRAASAAPLRASRER